MTKDPIVEDVRSARQKLFEACNEDLNALLDRFQEQEKLDRERLVSDVSARIGRPPDRCPRVAWALPVHPMFP
jgi:hypothetical protein